MSQKITPAAGPKLSGVETQQFLEWLRVEAQEAALRAALRRFDATGRKL